MESTVQVPINTEKQGMFKWFLLGTGMISILVFAIYILINHYPVILGSNYKILLSSEANKISIFLPFERSNESIYGAALIYEFDGTVTSINDTSYGKEIILDKSGLPNFYINSTTNFFTLTGADKISSVSENELKIGSHVRLRNRYAVTEPSSYFLESVLIKSN